jgi:hypothetical protein
MNRAVRMQHRRRCALKNTTGGGLNVNPAAVFMSSNGVNIPENQTYNECYSELRPGELVSQAQPELAQVAMAGGGCGCLRGGAAATSCDKAWLGGRRKTRRHRGGVRGFGIDPAVNIGGDGPIAEPARVGLPCDARAGSANPFSASVGMNPDPRAPAFAYSATPNQTGGGELSERVPNFEYGHTMMGGGYGGNAYPAECYRAPGSEMPVYPATSAGFHFTPSTAAGAALPDGVTAFNEVVAHVARGGRRKSYRNRKAGRKAGRKATRKAGRKATRKAYRNRKATRKAHRNRKATRKASRK